VTRRKEEEAIASFRQAAYPRPALAVDLVVFTVFDTDLKVLVVRRGKAPYEGQWALPGGFVRVGRSDEEQGEDLHAAAQRELNEETGLPVGTVYLEQLYTFGRAGRDPRTRVVTVAYYALVRPDLAPLVVAGGDAAAVSWASVVELRAGEGIGAGLAFDHDDILRVGIERIRGKIDYSAIAFELVPPTFTVAELRSVHEAIKATDYDPSNFRRRFKRMVADGIISKAPGKRATASRPASVYRFKRGDSSRAGADS
jgi:8-oxo-dGTP diphosphatase